jgi:glutamyl/glutaminyl-tRNA synthetase
MKALRAAWKKFVEERAITKQMRTLTAEGLDMEALKRLASVNEKYIKVTLPDRTTVEIWREIESTPDKNSGFW